MSEFWDAAKEKLLFRNKRGGGTLPVDAQYVFVDVAAFSDFTVPQQLYIVETLAGIAGAALAAFQVARRDRIYLPIGGDTLGIALTGDKPIDLNVRIATKILELLHEHNSAKAAKPVSFAVRIGLSRARDSRAQDITGRETLVGRGYAEAYQIMTLADGGQVLMSADDHKDISKDPPYSDSAHFKEYPRDVTGDLDVYQLVFPYPGVGIDTPKVFSAQRFEGDLKRLMHTKNLPALALDTRRGAIRSLVRSTFAEKAPGVSAFVDIVDSIAGIERHWRSDYHLTLRLERAPGNERLKAVATYSWKFENYTAQTIAYDQHITIHRPIEGRVRHFHVNGNRQELTLRASEQEDSQEATIGIPIPPTTPEGQPVRVQYETETLLDLDDFWLWSANLPVFKLTLRLDFPPELLEPSVMVFGLTADARHDNPTPPTDDREPGSWHWTFDGWFLRTHGIVIRWVREQKPQ